MAHSSSTHDSHHHAKHTHEGSPSHDHGTNRLELVFAILASLCTAVGWGLGHLNVAYASQGALGLFVGGYVFGGFFTLREAVEHLRARSFEIDLLMLVAAVGAALLGEWFEGALLLSLFSLGHALEHHALGKARRAIASLADLAPEHATVKRLGVVTTIGVSELVVGDVVLIKPDERIPADGFVLKGQSTVNQASVTGESVPVDKFPLDEGARQEAFDMIPAAHRLYAGTINGPGALTMHVMRPDSQSTLARVIALVESAQAMASPTQQFTDKFERIFVPCVLLLVGVLLMAFLVVDETFSQSFYRAMAVLVAASPCALAIATPSAVLSAIAAGGKSGVLVKGGAPLEHLGKIQAIAFDKTGTLTQGTPRVVKVWRAPDVEEDSLWSVVLAVERLSDHPIAQAVVSHATGVVQHDVPELVAHDMQSITGKGVRATIEGQHAQVGKAALFEGAYALDAETLETLTAFASQGHTVMAVQYGGKDLGVIGLMDTPREGVKRTLKELKELGMTRMIMLSGDHQSVASSIASQIGLDEAHGDLMPEDKVTFIKELGKKGSGVLMVGDGVNDAPAMAHATVAIAMGAAGSDTALETAQIALMSDDITRLPYAVALGRKTSRIIAQNLWLSLGMVAFLIPATLFGLSIGPAVALHEGSTLLVVMNALRLLKFRA